MKQLIVKPLEFETTLAGCPPGLFVFNGTLGMKSEYSTDAGEMEVYLASSGEAFWGGANSHKERNSLMVIPCGWCWEETEL